MKVRKGMLGKDHPIIILSLGSEVLETMLSQR